MRLTNKDILEDLKNKPLPKRNTFGFRVYLSDGSTHNFSGACFNPLPPFSRRSIGKKCVGFALRSTGPAYLSYPEDILRKYFIGDKTPWSSYIKLSKSNVKDYLQHGFFFNTKVCEKVPCSVMFNFLTALRSPIESSQQLECFRLMESLKVPGMNKWDPFVFAFSMHNFLFNHSRYGLTIPSVFYDAEGNLREGIRNDQAPGRQFREINSHIELNSDHAFSFWASWGHRFLPGYSPTIRDQFLRGDLSMKHLSNLEDFQLPNLKSFSEYYSYCRDSSIWGAYPNKYKKQVPNAWFKGEQDKVNRELGRLPSRTFNLQKTNKEEFDKAAKELWTEKLKIVIKTYERNQ